MKEAVVLIIDANYTMGRPLSSSAVDDDDGDCGGNGGASESKTRLDCAKEVAIDIVSDLMIRSKTHEVEVIVLNTKKTSNHFYEDEDDVDDQAIGRSSDVEADPNSATAASAADMDRDDDDEYEEGGDDVPFPNITQFSGNGEVMGVRKPLPGLLRKIHAIQPIRDDVHALFSKKKARLRGDFVSGIILAADSLHRRTAGKQFFRRIILLTDAEHKVAAANQQRLLVALDSLRAMECQLEVVGMDFEQQGDFATAAPAPGAVKAGATDVPDGEIQCNDGGDDDADNDNDDGESGTDVEGSDDADSADDEDDILTVKRQNEQLLINLANKTGGFVFAAKEIRDILEKILGSRFINPTKRKLIVEIAPGLVLDDARYYLLLSKASTPTLKKKLAMLDIGGGGGGSTEISFRNNALGEEMLQDFETTMSHWNVEDENEEILSNRISYAYRFGSDLVPFNAMDEAGLMTRSPVKLTILGYMDVSKVPQYLRIAPPYVLTGNDSRRCCAAIAALARALRRTQKVGIGTFVKTKDHDPILCGLFPLEDGDSPVHLVMMQLPFNSDVRIPHLSNFDDVLSKPKPKAEKVCDDLIDSLMLPNDALDYTHIPNPKIRSFYKTIVKRVLDRDAAVVRTRTDTLSGPMATPSEIRDRAQPALEAFRDVFRLKKIEKGKAKRTKK